MIGITKYAAEQLGDIVYVDQKAVGKVVSIGESVVSVYILTLVKCSIESVKTAADVYMPCDGKVTEVNSALESEP